MGYKRAEEILPKDIIVLIQQYVDGESIYIPRKENCRQAWGKNTTTRQEIVHRNMDIAKEYAKGYSTSELARRYFLSVKSIQRIIREMKL